MSNIFLVLFMFRYTRLLVSVVANVLYRPYPIKSSPSYDSKDVTVVIPTTFKNPAKLVRCLRSIDNCSPAAIFIVTVHANTARIGELCGLSSIKRAQVLGVEKLNKRRQLLVALGGVKTDLVVFADDNVFWPFHFLEHLLAIFEDPKVGAGGPRQRVRRGERTNMWNFLAISYLERRVWNNITTQAIDGSISTLSGRTAAYRTKILKNEEFAYHFVNDQWFGRKLNTDDDKCLTRYVYSHGWRIALQTSTTIETTMEDNWKYIEQCKRWARAHWRGNFTVMTKEKYWYSPRYSWGLYAIYLGQFQTPALLWDVLLLALLNTGLKDQTVSMRARALVVFGCWLLFTKIVKLIPHFCRYPTDILFVPLSISFSYLHGIINIYSLCTLHVTAWGSQQLDELEEPKAKSEQDVVPFLKKTYEEATYHEPTPGKLMEGEDYFNAKPAIS